MRLLRHLIPIACILVAPGTRAADERVASFDLPAFSAIFTIGCGPHAATLPRYFDDASLLALYPHLKPSKVSIAAGAKRVWQSGVIVTKDKKCLFWKTCSESFIAIDTSDDTFYFAENSEVHIEGVRNSQDLTKRSCMRAEDSQPERNDVEPRLD